MNVLCLFPKPIETSTRGLESVRVVTKAISGTISLLLDSGARPMILLEDSYGADMMMQYALGRYDNLSTITDVDYKYNRHKDNMIGLSSYYINHYSEAKSYTADCTKKFPLPIISKYKDKSLYANDREKVIERRMKYCNMKLSKEYDAIVYFDMPRQNVFEKPVREQGDGRFLMYVDLTTGVVTTYYGGVFIDIETAKTVLNMIGEMP